MHLYVDPSGRWLPARVSNRRRSGPQVLMGGVGI